MNQTMHIYASSDTPRSAHHQLTGKILMDLMGILCWSIAIEVLVDCAQVVGIPIFQEKRAVFWGGCCAHERPKDIEIGKLSICVVQFLVMFGTGYGIVYWYFSLCFGFCRFLTPKS